MMHGRIHLYLIFYGSWTARQVAILEDAARGMGNTPWMSIVTVVVDVARPMDSLFATRGGRSFLYAADPEPVRHTNFNAGVWLVRNTPGGREVMESWLAQFHPEHWTRGSDGKWRTSRMWAGTAYEQVG